MASEFTHTLAQMHILPCFWLPFNSVKWIRVKKKTMKTMEMGLKISKLAKVQACGLMFTTYWVIHLLRARAVN